MQRAVGVKLLAGELRTVLVLLRPSAGTTSVTGSGSAFEVISHEYATSQVLTTSTQWL